MHRRKPRRGVIPPYAKMDVLGNVKQLPIKALISTDSNESIFGNRNVICPYTNLIPIIYLGNCNRLYKRTNSINSAEIWRWDLQCGENEALKSLGNYYLGNLSGNPGDIINKYLKEDSRLLFDDWDNYSYHGESSFEHIGTSATYRLGNGHSNKGRVTLAPYTFTFEDDYDIQIPYVMAVTLPENYIYHKLSILKNGYIDLSKVIILIDRELDTPAFPNKYLRAYFREYIYPKIIETNCDVWEVPQTFIKYNCFLGRYSQTGTIEERRERFGELVNNFLTSNVTNNSEFSFTLNSAPTIVSSDSVLINIINGSMDNENVEF